MLICGELVARVLQLKTKKLLIKGMARIIFPPSLEKLLLESNTITVAVVLTMERKATPKMFQLQRH